MSTFNDKNKSSSAFSSVDYYQQLFVDAPIAMASASLNGRIIEANYLFCELLGYDKDTLKNLNYKEITYIEDRENSKKQLQRLIENKVSILEMEKRYIKGNGSIIWGKITANLIKDTNGKPDRIVLILVDITQQKMTEIDLRNSVENLFEKAHLMKSLMENNPDVVIMKSVEGKYLFFNKAAEKVTGKKAVDILGKGIETVFPPHVAKELTKQDKEIYENEDTVTIEEQVKDSSGNELSFLTTKGPIYDDNHKILGMFSIARDISKRKLWEKALFENERKYRWITENAADVIAVFNLTRGQFTFVSPSVTNLIGFSSEEAINLTLREIIVPESIKVFENSLLTHLNQFRHNPNPNNYYTFEVEIFTKSGSRVWVETSIRFEYNELKELESVNIVRNIEERKKAEEDMLRLSYYDQLTGVYNRRFYEEELNRLDTKRNFPLALIMADVNGLKLANDAFGHSEGDLLLKTIARILKKECRSDEIISRIGGDEFIILIPQTKGEDVSKLIQRINKAVSDEKINHGILSLSMGYAVKENEDEKIHEVFKRAEDDMYSHKLSESSSMRSKTIDLIMKSLFEKSNREMLHSDRVSMMCSSLAREMGFKQEEINQTKIAGLVHDIGKIGINNTILDKPGKLTDDEWIEIKKHCEVGYRILSSVNEFSEIANFVLSHQERWDGKGYPQGLKGEAIPIQARIIAVADSFDAMTSDRTYRSGMSNAEAASELIKCAGSQFDPEIAKIFVKKVIPKMQS